MNYLQISRPYRVEWKPRPQSVYYRIITCNNCRPIAEKFLGNRQFMGALIVKHFDRFDKVVCELCEVEPCCEPAPCKCVRCEI